MNRVKILLSLFFFITATFCCAYGNDDAIKELRKENDALTVRLTELERKYKEDTDELRAMIVDLKKKIESGVARAPAPETKTEKGTISEKRREGSIPDLLRVMLVEETVTDRETGKRKGWTPRPPLKPVKAGPGDLALKPYVTLVLQGCPNPNIAGSGKFGGSYQADLDIEKQFGNWGLAFLELRMGQGTTVMDDLEVFSNVDNNADDTGSNVVAQKFWYNQYLFDRQLTLCAGKLDASDWIDQNRYANDDTCQFLGSIFNNSPVIEWPADIGFGARAHVCAEPLRFLAFDLGYYDGTGSWNNMFDHGVYAAQANLKPAILLDLDKEQWEGNYRLYWWLNTRNHVKLLAPGARRENNYGFGLSCDQMITDKFGLFGRFGWQRPDIIPASGAPTGATLEYTWSLGAQIEGALWKREYDALGLAVGQIFPSERYDDAGNDARGEGHVELYYKCQLNKHIGISPDVQIIWNPDGSETKDDPVFVYGVRSHLNF